MLRLQFVERTDTHYTARMIGYGAHTEATFKHNSLWSLKVLCLSVAEREPHVIDRIDRLFNAIAANEGQDDSHPGYTEPVHVSADSADFYEDH